MANKKITLMRRCKTPTGWRYYPVVIGKTGKVKPGFVSVGDIEVGYKIGYYALRSFNGQSTVFTRLGDDATEALAARDRAIHLVDAKTSAVAAGALIVEEPGRKILAREFVKFLQAAEDRGSDEAVEVYRLAGEEFLAGLGKTYADEIKPEDLLKHQRSLRKRGCSDRTIYNRHCNVASFLRYCKLDVKNLAPIKPKFEKSLPEIYTPEELKPFFESLNNSHYHLIFDLLLKTGLREQEAMYLYWSNIDLTGAVLQVRSKPEYKFKIKDKEQRDMPIPADLVARLSAYRLAHPGRRLVTGTQSDRPNKKLLRTLKRLVASAGLACGNCDGCVTRRECDQWFLHKFRATYITMLIRQKMDLRTVMKLSGHSDLASVMRYLRPASDEAIQAMVSEVKWM